MVGMVVGPDHRVDVADIGVEQLLAQVGAGVDQDPRRRRGSTRIETRAAAVARLGRVAVAPVIADPRHAGRRAAAEHPQLHAGGLGEQTLEVGAGGLGRELLDRLAAQLGEEARGVGDEGRLARSCRGAGTGARKGESVSISSRSSGIVLRRRPADRVAFLKVTIPEIEM